MFENININVLKTADRIRRSDTWTTFDVRPEVCYCHVTLSSNQLKNIKNLRSWSGILANLSDSLKESIFGQIFFFVVRNW